MTKIWLGWGGVKFVAGGYTAEFTTSRQKITIKPIIFKKRNINHKLISRTYGYTMTIDVSDMLNLDDNDYIQYQNLMNILSLQNYDVGDQTIYIYPNYDSSLDNNLYYECILVSEITPKDIANLKLGQTLSLKFEVVSKLDTIPTFVSDTEANKYYDGTDEYTDESGNNYIDNGG